MKICFASHNQNKVKEIAELAPPGIQIIGLSELGCTEDIEETGATMEENSSIKAHYVYDKYALPVFSDDSGLEVNALNGAPGVYSARYAGPEKDNQKNIELLQRNLKNVEDKSAQFKSVITFVNQEGQETQFVGTVSGQIIQEQRGVNGFGYDPVFVPKGHSRTFAEMTSEEKHKLSHRAKAFHKLLSYLVKLNG
jgi:XTP/dITP diphosphohydrolase